jgi:polyhydroxyalkanoate synthesis regulator phasin
MAEDLIKERVDGGRTMRKEITEAQITELMAAIPRAEEVDRLRAEIERLRADLATQQGCCDGAASQDAHVRREREEHRAEVERLREEIEYLRKAHQTAIEWSNLYRTDNIRMRYEIERMKEGGQ